MIHRITAWLGRGGLVRKMLALFLLLVLLPSLAVGALLYSNSVRKQIEDTLAYEQRMVEMMGAQVQMRTAQVERLADTLANDALILRLLSRTYSTSRTDMILDLETVAGTTLGSIASHLKDVNAFVTLYAAREDIPEKYYTVLHEAWLQGEDYDAFMKSAAAGAWGLRRTVMPAQIASPHELNALVLPYYRKVTNLTGLHLGTVMVGVVPQRLFMPLAVESGGLWVLQGDTVLYRDGDAQALPAQPVSHGQVISGDMYLTYGLSPLDIRVVRRVPYAPIVSAAVRGNMALFAVVLAAGVLYVVLGWLLLRQVLARLKQTVQAIAQSGNADHHVQLPVTGGDEIAQLIEAFNALLRRIEGQVGELLSKEEAKREAQILALQYQINPHFLFNSLHFMQMAMEERGEEAMAEAIALLGGILRYNLSDHPYATLAQELDHLRGYVAFMALWKGEAIRLDIECPDSLYARRILRFALQPVIENALQHGLIPGQPLGILVKIVQEKEALYIAVENDGAVISQETLNQVRLVLASAHGEEDMLHGVGLRNLSRRLYLIYGEGTAISVSSALGKTLFELRLMPRREVART